jgi:L-malate glycosyltransferase
VRLAIVTLMGGAAWGGSEDLWADAARCARERGDEVLVMRFACSREAEQVRALRSCGVDIRHRVFRHRKIQKQLDRVLDPLRPVRTFRPDAIILNQGGTFDLLNDPSLARLEGLLRIGAPYLVVCHGNSEDAIPIGERREIAGRIFGGARRVCFVSNRMHAIAERQLAAAIPNAAIVRNPVRAPGRVQPLEMRDDLRMAIIARLDANKGVEVVLEALAAETWRARRWTLEIAGDGPLAGYFSELARFYRIDSNVRFLGHQSDVHPVIARANLIVLTSRSEGLPISLLEGALAARPLLATNVGGVGELVMDGVTGFLAEGATLGGVGNALERAWQSRRELSRLGEAARRHAETFIDPAPGRSLLALLDQRVSSGERPAAKVPGVSA